MLTSEAQSLAVRCLPDYIFLSLDSQSTLRFRVATSKAVRISADETPSQTACNRPGASLRLHLGQQRLIRLIIRVIHYEHAIASLRLERCTETAKLQNVFT